MVRHSDPKVLCVFQLSEYRTHKVGQKEKINCIQKVKSYGDCAYQVLWLRNLTSNSKHLAAFFWGSIITTGRRGTRQPAHPAWFQAPAFVGSERFYSVNLAEPPFIQRNWGLTERPTYTVSLKVHTPGLKFNRALFNGNAFSHIFFHWSPFYEWARQKKRVFLKLFLILQPRMFCHMYEVTLSVHWPE